MDLNNLYDTINFLKDKFLKINKLWIDSNRYKKINLKNTLVRDIYAERTNFEIIREYQSFLIESTVELTLELEKKYDVASRVKTPNSIEDKIRRYNSDSHENGKIAICKCLNDLFGARIILDKKVSFLDISDFIEDRKILNIGNVSLKCIDSSKNGYIATHIYLKKEKDNSIFQWELQIWDIKDVSNNIESHKIYKQEYATWENKIIKREE